MDITLKDVNSDQTVYQLADADRAALAVANLLTDNYKGGGQTVKYDPSIWDNATVFDPNAQLSADETADAALQAKISTEQTEISDLSKQQTPPQQLPPQ